MREGRVLIMKQVIGLGLDLGKNTNAWLLDKLKKVRFTAKRLFYVELSRKSSELG